MACELLAAFGRARALTITARHGCQDFAADAVVTPENREAFIQAKTTWKLKTSIYDEVCERLQDACNLQTTRGNGRHMRTPHMSTHLPMHSSGHASPQRAAERPATEGARQCAGDFGPQAREIRGRPFPTCLCPFFLTDCFAAQRARAGPISQRPSQHQRGRAEAVHAICGLHRRLRGEPSRHKGMGVGAAGCTPLD